MSRWPEAEDDGAEPEHTPVLLTAVLEVLAVGSGRSYIDATLGLGGHAGAILAATAPRGRLLGIDADPDAVERAGQRLQIYGERAVMVQGNFRQIEAIATARGFSAVDGILFDLGVSSLQLSDRGRGFSFRHSAALDMRMDPALEQTAAGLVNQLGEEELRTLLVRYGEEPAARRIARAIVRERPFERTTDLAKTVRAAVGRPPSRTHPATRTFQALRIAVNDELESLAEALAATLALLRVGGRLAVISFHSLEDRIVKRFLRRESQGCVCPPGLPVCVCSHEPALRVLRRSVVLPSAAEVAANARSRSAKLRVAERI